MARKENKTNKKLKQTGETRETKQNKTYNSGVVRLSMIKRMMEYRISLL